MNTTFSLQQLYRTINLDTNSISNQYKLNLMADSLPRKHENPKLKQSETANQLGYFCSFLQRYTIDMNMLSPYGIQPNITNKLSKKAQKTNLSNNPHRDHDLKRPQMTPIEIVKTDTNTKSNRRDKNILKTGSIYENIENKDRYLDEILH